MKHLRFLSFGKLAAACLFSFLSVQSFGQVSLVTESEPGSFGAPVINGNGGDACVNNITTPTPASYTFSLPGVTLNSPTYKWSIKGGFDIPGSTSGSSVIVLPEVDDKGRYNKGRLTIFYKGTVDSTYTVTLTDVCGDGETREEDVTIQVPRSGVAWIDLYQKFDHSQPIVGDVCVISGQSEAYSIKDLVSGNIQDGIGIDDYYWDYSQVVSSSASHIYESGDKSAQTLKFGTKQEVETIGGKQMSVIIGKCNTEDTVFTTFKGELGKQLITSSEGECIPTNINTVTLTHPNSPNVTYTWEIPSYTGYSFVSNPAQTNPVTIKINKNAGIVLLKSVAEEGNLNYCTQEPRIDTFYVNRSLGTNDDITGVTCVEEGNTYEYSISPNPGAAIDWSLPTGWSIVGGAINENASTIDVNIASNAISGTITATTSGCGGSGIELDVNVKPGNPGAITGETCLDGSEFLEVYSVSAVSPAAESYSWTYPSGWSVQGPTDGASIVLEPDGSTSGSITVEALGNANCDANQDSELDVEYGGLKPDNILSDTDCINSGKIDNVVFEVETPITGQTYEWDFPSGWSILTNNNSSIVVETDGTNGSFEVKARATNSCGTSAWETYNGSITALSYTLDATDFGWGEAYSVDSITSPDAIDWYVNDVHAQSGNNFLLQGSNTGELCVDVIKNGCLTRKCLETDYAPAARMANTTGLKSNSLEGVQVTPNPASENLVITVPGKFNSGSYELLSVDGKLAKSGSLNGSETQVNTTEVSNGTYILKTETDGNVTVSKVLIQK